MNIQVKSALYFFIFLGFTGHASAFLDAAQIQVNKITNKKPIVYKSPLEFKQAVARYIKNTDYSCFQNIQRSSDENIAYKKELHYLFKNYGKFSAITLLSRLRSAHQAMVKGDTNIEGEVYQRYEQISSALLLTCAQVFSNEMRGQILRALHDVDNLLAYWRYQNNHQVRYFFSKSPVKWIMGKEQEKEIIHNISKLERKQKELYTLLGSLTGHAHSLTEVEIKYEDCYAWIEQLCTITHYVKITSPYTTDESRFDQIAAELELKLKRVSKFKSDCLASIAGARRPNRFVRNWVLYSTLLVVGAYMVHYNAKNPEVVRSACNAVQDEASKILILLLHPLYKIYERAQLVFSEEEKKEDEKKQIDELKKMPGETASDVPIDRDAELKDLLQRIIKIGKEADFSISEELEKSITSIRQDGLRHFREAVTQIKDNAKASYMSSTITIDELAVNQALERIEIIVQPIKENEEVINKVAIKQYNDDLAYLYKFAEDTISKLDVLSAYDRGLLARLAIGYGSVRLDNDFLNSLHKYTIIIDKKILTLFDLAAKIVDNLATQADDLIKKANDLEIDANHKLKDLELTLMFTSLIPLGITGLGVSKMYEWSTTRDYSAIRIALADVNALLIEASNHLDDHDYGKLVYLICKLRHKSTYLKNSLADNFLHDVAKLESKQYSAQTKHGIVENMFNKYAFLGKIAK